MLSSSLKRFIVAGVVLFAGAPAFAIDIPISNGSFETTTGPVNTFGGAVTGWTHTFLQTDVNNNFIASDSLGVFTTFAGLTATNGSQFVVINNEGAGSVVLTTPLINLQNQFNLNGSFAYISNDSLAVVNRDSFDIVITYYTDATGLVQAQPAITFFVDPSLPPFSGTPVATNGPFGVTAFRLAGGWTSFNIFLNGIAHTQFVRFQFVVHDDGTEDGFVSTGVSGVALDNIFINPEPGTMALFGLGGLGLAGLAWRRRKLKLAK